MWKAVKKLRWVIFILIPVFLSTVTFGQALAAKYEVVPYDTVATTSGNDSGKTTGESSVVKLNELIVKISEELEKSSPDAAKITQLSGELRNLDRRIMDEFKSTEAMLRAGNVPDEILKRHQDFVSQYQENLNSVLDGVKPYDTGLLGLKTLFGSSMNTEDSKKIDNLRKKMKEKWISKEFNPFKNGFPKKNADFHPGEPKLNPSITPAYDYTPNSQITSDTTSSLQPSAVPNSLQALNTNLNNLSAATDDLQETIEVNITPEIKQLARELGNNPVKIFEYVHNNIDYSPYYGSVKGAQETLWQKAGNDFDQASLLIAMLRVSGIPARYVYGVVRIPVDQVKNWIGIKDERTALNTFATNGIPSRTLMIGAKSAFLEKEHVWVEAYVPVDSYRGSDSGDSGKGWVPMDPSFKQYVETPKLDLQQEVPFDTQKFINEVQGSATVGDNGFSSTNIDRNTVKQKFDDYQNSMQTYLNNHPDLTMDDILGSRKIFSEKYSVLALSLPYQVLSVQQEFSNPANSYRQKIRFWLEDVYDFLGGSQCNYTASIPEIGSKQVTLKYIAATENDKKLIAKYMPNRTDEIATQQVQLPAYLIQVKPQLTVDGVVVATGTPVTMGTTQKFYMNFTYPTRVGDPQETVENEITAGGVYVITLDTGEVTTQVVNKYKNILNSSMNDSNSKFTYMDQMLHIIGLSYFMQVDFYNKVFSNNNNVRTEKMVSEAITSINFGTIYVFGMPRDIYFGNLGIDVDRDLYSVHSINGDPGDVKRFFNSSGIMGSYLEGLIFQQIFGQESISTVHVFLAANQQGIKVYQMDSTNVDSILPKLQYGSTKREMFKNQVNNGKIVFVPEKPLSIGSWTGTGYIIQDPIYATGAYMIDNGTNGGALSWGKFGGMVAEAIIGWLIQEVLDEFFPEPKSDFLGHLRSFLAYVITGISCAFFNYLMAAVFMGFWGGLIALVLASLLCLILMLAMYYLIEYADNHWTYLDNKFRKPGFQICKITRGFSCNAS